MSLILAVVLSAAAIVLLRPGPAGGNGGSGSGPLLEFDPAGVRALAITHPDGRVERIRRDGEGWVLEAGEREPWVLTAPQVRGLLRILSNLPGDSPATEGEVGPSPVRVGVELEDGGSRELIIGTAALSGRVAAKAGTGREARVCWIRADLPEALTRPGPLGWRDPTLLRGVGPEVSRVVLRGPSGSVTLGRAQGRWSVREPIAAPADEGAVGRLLTTLSRVRIADFLDGGAPADTGLQSPSATATLESIERDARGAAVVHTQTLRVGRSADIAGTKIYVEVERGTGRRVVAAAAESLATITTDPATYVSRQAAPGPASDVGLVTVGTARTFTRTLDGWSTTGADGSTAPAPAPDAEGVTLVLRLLCEAPADQAMLNAPAQAETRWTVELASLGGTPIASVSIGVAPGEQGRGGVVLRTGEVWRIYASPAAFEAVRWLDAATGR